MSITTTIPIAKYVEFVSKILKLKKYLGMWLPATALFKYFCVLNNFPDVTKRMFNTRMSTLCTINSNVFIKKLFDKNTRKYSTWYLFILADSICSETDIECIFTRHAADTFQFSDQIDSDMQKSDMSDMQNSDFPSTSSSAFDTTSDHTNYFAAPAIDPNTAHGQNSPPKPSFWESPDAKEHFELYKGYSEISV